MKLKKVEELFDRKISEFTSEKELKGVKILNTENFSGRTNGLPFFSYESYLLNEENEEYLDLNLIIQTLKSFFNELFRWKGVSNKESRKIEELLFKNGSAAIVKLPDGELYICGYSASKWDNYGYPKEITLVDKYNDIMNNKTYKKNFAVVFNHISHQSTPLLIWSRILGYLDALRRIDVVNRTSDNKVLISNNADDLIVEELNQEWYSEKPFLKVNPDMLKMSHFEHISLTDNSNIKMELFMFHLNLILTYLGLKSSQMVEKAERQTELEVANNDKFGGMILKNMLRIRQEGQDEIKEKLGLNITLEEPEYFKQQEAEGQKDISPTNNEVPKEVKNEK